MKKDRVIYYSDPINDDFAGNKIKQKIIDDSYPYERSRLWRIASHLLYYCIAIPAVAFVCFVVHGFRFKNKKAIRKLKTGYCLYGNHTHNSDVFLPPLVAWPKRAYTISSADAVSLGCFSWVTPMLGAIPIPTGMKGMTKFLSAIKKRCEDGNCIGIFPEAHIWPFYTGIRPLQRISFRYPVSWDCPMVVMATTYQRRRLFGILIKKPRRTLYISEPMYPNPDLAQKEAQEELRARAQDFLERMSKEHSDYSYIRYEQKSAENEVEVGK